MTKKEVSALLRKARDLMNNEGAHWVKGVLKSGYGPNASFCSYGAIIEVTGSKHGPKLNMMTDEKRPAVYALANAILAEQGKLPIAACSTINDERALAIIFRYNDRNGRKWPDIHRIFTKAASKPIYPGPVKTK